MGIKKLYSFLNTHSGIINEIKFSELKGKKIAIDISLLIYQTVIGIRNSGSDIVNQQGKSVSHIVGLFNKIVMLLSNNIIPVFVFDGKPSEFKENTILKRKKRKLKAYEKLDEITDSQEKIKYFKQTVSISKENIEDCKELLNLMGIPYVVSPEESDSQCAYMAQHGLVDSVYTDDMDILTFGSPKIIKNLFNKNKKIVEINLNTILTKLNLNYEEFIEFCLLLGSDYNNGLLVPYTDIYNVFSKYKNIKLTLQKLKENFKVPKVFNYEKIKEYYIKSPHIEVNIDNLLLKTINKNELIDVLVNKHGLLKFLVIKKINKL
jgi:flap endonuclease-1